MKKAISIKICGMKNPGNISEIAALQPDYLGFIFYKKSARYFDGEIPAIPETIKKTGVFVNAYIATVIDTIKRYNLQAVQLHGDETPVMCSSLKKLFDIEIIKTFSVGDMFDFSVLQDYETVCDFYLFDTKGKLPGGNGFAFNWNVLQQYPSQKPYFLSGGIELNDIRTILESELSPYAIDINSKFETEPGLKNKNLCEQAVLTLKKQ